MPELLKLMALDHDDLEVVSAHLQDASARVGEMAWLRSERRFALVVDRFDWEGAIAPEPVYRRRRTGLHFECVSHVRSRGVALDQPEAQLTLLSIGFVEDELPSGRVVLLFLGGGAIEIDVECLEARLSDLGPAWTAATCPRHAESEPVTAAPARRGA